MKMKLPKNFSKNKILLVALLLVAVVGYYIFATGGDEPLTVSESGSEVTIGQEIIIELNRLKALRNIKDDIFVDPVFVSLQDFTQEVISEPLGRNNPFSPIGVE